MANLVEVTQWEDGVYQLEPADPVEGGAGKIDNWQAQALANRTRYLKQQVEAKAPLASPALTGSPTAPTPTAGDNSLRLATTAFIQQAIAALVNSSPAALDTLFELAAALGNDANFAATMTNALAAKAPLASPTLSGTPSGPTAAFGTNSTQLATTAFAMAIGWRFRDAFGIGISANTTLNASQRNSWAEVQAAGLTVTLPALASLINGDTYTFRAIYDFTLKADGAETIIYFPGNQGNTVTVSAGEVLTVAKSGNTNWFVVSVGFSANAPTLTGNPKFTGNPVIYSVAPVLRFQETDGAVAGGGLRRLVLDGNTFSIRRNTAAAGDFSTEVSDLFIDGNGNVVKTGTDGSKLSVESTSSTGASWPQIEVSNYSANGGFPVVELRGARGTKAAAGSAAAGDVLGGYNAWGHTGAAWASATRIEAVAEAAFSAAVSACLRILTTVAGVQSEAGRFTGRGALLLGTTIDDGVNRLQVSGDVKATGKGTFGKLANSTLFEKGAGSEGGELRLEKPTTSTLAGDTVIDLFAEKIRFFENGGTFRGLYLDLTTCGAGADSTKIWHSGNDGPGSGLDADTLDGQQGSYYAPIASPAFTGTPTVPTAAPGTNTTQIANMAAVQAAIAALVNSSPEALNTLNEFAAALGNDPNFATTVTNAIAAKLSLSGGTMTGYLGLVSGSTFLREGGAEGGQFYLEKPATGTTLVGNVVVDVAGDSIRIFDGGGAAKGFYLSFPDGFAGVSAAIWHQGNDGAGSGLDADLLDGQQGSYYADVIARLGYTPLNQAGGSLTGVVSAAGTAGGMGNATGSLGKLEVKNVQGVGNAAFMQFHRQGEFAAYFGLDIDNQWKVGGYSMGAVAHKLWHEGNDGIGSGLNADLLDGFESAYGATAYTVAVRDSGGNLTANYYNQNSGNNENPTVSQVMVTNGSDTYVRKASLAHVMSQMGFANSLAASGYQKLPGGLIIQWLRATLPPSTALTFTWPITFPSACINAQLSVLVGAGSTHYLSNITTTGGTADFTNGTDGGDGFILGIGY